MSASAPQLRKSTKDKQKDKKAGAEVPGLCSSHLSPGCIPETHHAGPAGVQGDSHRAEQPHVPLPHSTWPCLSHRACLPPCLSVRASSRLFLDQRAKSAVTLSPA